MTSPHRKRLPTSRKSVTHHGVACGVDFYIILSFYDDTHDIGEVFVKILKEGHDVAGWIDMWAMTTSIALQYGVPWKDLYEKYRHQQFGMFDNENPSLIHAFAETINSLVDKHKSLYLDAPPVRSEGGKTS